jgi:phage terminase large subunit
MKKYQVNLDTQTIDSAEGALRNQYNKDYGIYLTPARKKDKEKMIENVEDLLAQNRVYVLTRKVKPMKAIPSLQIMSGAAKKL